MMWKREGKAGVVFVCLFVFVFVFVPSLGLHLSSQARSLIRAAVAKPTLEPQQHRI